jgi:hypothetical protein
MKTTALNQLTSTIKSRIDSLFQEKEFDIFRDIKGIVTDPDRLSEVLAQFITHLVEGLVEEKYQEAVLARAAEQIPLDAKPVFNPFQVKDTQEKIFLSVLAEYDQPTPWPSNISLDDVIAALGKSKDKQAVKVSRLMTRMVKENRPSRIAEPAPKARKASKASKAPKRSEIGHNNLSFIYKSPFPTLLPDIDLLQPEDIQFLLNGEEADVAAKFLELNNKHDERLSEVYKVYGDPQYEPLFSWPLLPCMIIVSLDKDVRRELMESMIAIDASVPHHEVVAGWTKETKKPKAKRTRKRSLYRAQDNPGRLELLAPGGSVQIRIPFDGQSLTESFVETIRNWRDWFGLRNWAALQRLLSDKGMRTGRVRWLLSEHLDALGYSERSREDPELREKIAKEVELFTQLEIAIYNPDGTLRLREPILSSTRKYDALRDGKWALEGMELQIAQSLYEGIRNFETDKLGSNWFPAPAELPQIDHRNYPHAIALGLILPMRWRWAWSEKKEYVALSGQKLLELANIPQSPENPRRAWDTLKLNLDELERIKSIGRIEWKGEPYTSSAVARIYPSHKLLDRTHRGLRAIEAKKPDLPVTGAEFVEWRKGKGWSQAEAAKQLGVGIATVKRTESLLEKKIGPSLRKALEKIGRPPEPPPTPVGPV